MTGMLGKRLSLAGAVSMAVCATVATPVDLSSALDLKVAQAGPGNSGPGGTDPGGSGPDNAGPGGQGGGSNDGTGNGNPGGSGPGNSWAHVTTKHDQTDTNTPVFP